MPEAASVRNGPCRDRVDADAGTAEIDREVADGSLQRRLGHTHDVVVRRDLLGTDVGQGEQAAALRHQWLGAAGEVGEGEAGDQHGCAGNCRCWY